jgi:hypothetical protein
MEAELRPAAAWIIDDTGFSKQGRHSVGVARQYSGTLGQAGNCQVAMTVNLRTATESVPLDWALYLPQAWTEDAGTLPPSWGASATALPHACHAALSRACSSAARSKSL